MSEENVEVVRRMYEAFHAGDFEGALACFDPEVIFDASMRVDGGIGRGREELAAMVAQWVGGWDEWREKIEEMRDLGGQVLVVSRQHGRAKGRGIEVEAGYAVLYEVDGDSITRMAIYSEPAEALEAAGPEEWAMSEENVESARSGIDAWNRGDLEEWLAGFAPDGELHTTGRFADRGVYRERAGLERYWAEIREDIEEPRVSVTDMRAVGDKVFYAVTGRGRGKRSGAPVERSMWFVTTFRDGLAVRLETYDDCAEALEAAGLGE